MDLGSGSLANLALIRDYESRRVSSWDRSGGNADCLTIPPGEKVTLAQITGSGIIRHIWMTMASFPSEQHELRQTVLRIFWDGATAPSVETPPRRLLRHRLRTASQFRVAAVADESAGRERVQLLVPDAVCERCELRDRDQGEQRRWLFFYIDYEQHRSIDANLGRFHAWWNRTNPTAGTAREQGYTRKDYGLDDNRPVGMGFGVGGPWQEPNLTGERNYVILDTEGKGHYVGCNLNIDVFERQVNDWYGEGDDMIFIDGEPWPPRLHGTGTEDYFNTAFCPKQEYSAPYHGITVYSGDEGWPWGGKNSMYRFHIEDPIRFDKSIRVTIETGHNNALANDYSSTAYWYAIEPVKPLPPLPPVEARAPRPDPPGLRRR